jgi:putative transcriptional regulator
MSIIFRLDRVMADRKMALGELAKRIDLTDSNLSILKTGKAKAIRLQTLEAICRELKCQPGDLLEYQNESNPK